MKVFKRVYFSAMAVLMVALIVLSFVIGASGSFKSVYSNNFYSNIEMHLAEVGQDSRNEFNSAHLTVSRNYIADAVSSVTIKVDDNIDEEDNKTIAEIAIRNSKPHATLVVQSALVLDETQKLIPFESAIVSAAKTVENIIVYLPGTVTVDGGQGDAILFTAHYDSISTGASDNASAVAAMLESIRYIQENEIKHENDLLFVFTDAKEQGSLGAFTFINQFKGFNNVVENIALAVDFSSMGASSKLMLVDSSVKDANLLKALRSSGVFGYSLNSVVNYANNDGKRISDFDAFSGIPALGFANVNKTYKSKTTQDVVNESSIILAKNIGNIIVGLSNELGNTDLSGLSDGGSAVYFEYLGLSVVYSNVVSYCFGGLIIALLAVVIVLSLKKKSFDLLKTVIGLMVQVLSVAATICVLYVCYFVTTLILSGFGVLPFNIITAIVYANPAIILLTMLLSGAVMSGFYIVLKKAFNVNAGDIVRGNALIWVLLGLIFSFAATKIGFVFTFGAILNLIVTLVFVLLRDKYNALAVKENKNSRLAGIGGLFMYVWAAILLLPLVIGVITITSNYALTIMLPLLASLLMGLLGAALPYADYIKPSIDKAFEKLPKRKITRKVKVIERQEDRAKKGKFSDVEVIKKETVTIERKYTNILGVLIVSVICIISLVFASAFGLDFNTNLTQWKTIDNTVYDGAIVYEWEKASDGSVTTNLVIADPVAYRYASMYVTGYKWDTDRKVYLKDYNNQILSQHSMPAVTKSGDVFSFSVFEQTQGKVRVKLSGISGYTLLTFSNGDVSFSYDNLLGEDEIEFKLPRGFGDFTITCEGSAAQVQVNYEESVPANSSSDSIVDVLTVRDGFEKSGIINDDFKSGIVLKIESVL